MSANATEHSSLLTLGSNYFPSDGRVENSNPEPMQRASGSASDVTPLGT